jgi:hypothetical protein
VTGSKRPGPPTDWAALQYEPSAAPVRRCDRRGCGAAYVDDEPSRQSHIQVFGHAPRPPEPELPAPEEGSR